MMEPFMKAIFQFVKIQHDIDLDPKIHQKFVRNRSSETQPRSQETQDGLVWATLLVNCLGITVFYVGLLCID